MVQKNIINDNAIQSNDGKLDTISELTPGHGIDLLNDTSISGNLTVSSCNLTSSSNQLVVQPSGTGGKFYITATNPSFDRTLTIPDPGTNANFILSAGNQIINDVKTFSNFVKC